MARCGSAQDFAIVTGPVSDYWGLTDDNKLYANRDGVAIGFTAAPNYMLHVDGTLSAAELLVPDGAGGVSTTLDWSSVYTSVNLQSGEWDSTWNTLTANSAAWDRGASAYTTVNLQSGEWDSTWNTLTANSAHWTWVADNSATFYENVLAKHNVTIDGDLTVKGTTATLEVTDLHVEDKLIRLNRGGAADTGFDVGFEIEEDSSSTGYIKTGDTNNDDKWLIKAPDGNILTLDIDADKTFQILGDLHVAHNENTGGSYIDQDVRQAAQNVTFAGLHVGSLSLSPAGLEGTLTTSSGDLQLDAQSNIVHFNATTFTLAAQAVDILLKDNETESLEFLQGSNKYLTFRTTDNEEQLIAHKQLSVNELLSAKEGIATNVITVTSSGSFGSGDNSAAAGLSSYGHMRVQNSYIEVDGINVDGHSIKTSGGASFGNGSSDKMNFNAGTWTFASRMYWNLHESHTDNRGLVFQKNGVGSPILVIDSDNIRIGVNTAAPDYEIDVAGDIGIGTDGGTNYIYHNGDVDTFIKFATDDISIQAGGVDFIKITEDGTQDQIRFNDGGVDVDFVVETDQVTDAFTIDGEAYGSATFKIPVTVGENDIGQDVKFFGATAGQYLLWDQSADELVLVGDSKLSFHDAAGGENIIATADGHLEVNAGTTLDATAPTIDLNGSTKVNVDAGLFDVNATGDITLDSATDVWIAAATTTVTLDAKTDIVLDAEGADIIFQHSGTESGKFTQNGATSLTLDVVGDLILDADGGNITLKDGGTHGLDFSNSGGDWIVKPLTTDKDVIFAEDGGNEIARFDSSAEALLMATSKKIEFHDGGQYIHAAADKHLDIVAETEIHLTAPTVNIDASTDTNVSNNLTVGGDLTVNGTTTTVNSTTVTVDDPIITLGGDTAPGSDDEKDRGVEFRYFSGSAKVGFFGFDTTNDRFTFLTDATNSSEVFSGTLGDIEVGGGLLGNIQVGITGDNEIDTSSGNLTIDSTGGTVTVDDNLTITGDVLANDDVSLNSDAAILNFGEHSEVNLTHVHDTGLLLNAAMQLQFRDAAIYIASTDDGHLDLAADTSIDHNTSVINFGLGTTADTTINFLGNSTNDGEVKWDQSENQLLFDTHLLVIDYTDNTVGVNIEAGTNPTHVLHVSGGKNNDVIGIFDSPDTLSLIAFKDNSTSSTLLPVIGVKGDDVIIGTNRAGASTKSHFVLDTSLSAIAVGTFTSHPTPKSTFDIRGDGQETGHSQLTLTYDDGNGSTASSMLSTDYDGNLHIRPESSRHITFRERDVHLRKIVSENSDDVTVQLGNSSGNRLIVQGTSNQHLVVDSAYGETGIGMAPVSNSQLSLAQNSYEDALRLYYDTNNYVRLQAKEGAPGYQGGLKISTVLDGAATAGDPYSTNKTGAVYISGG